MELEILNNAAKKINEVDGILCRILDTELHIAERYADALILLQKDDYQKKFNVEVKTKIVPAQIPKLKEEMEGLAPYILIAEYITTKARKILQNEQIPYLDTAGNAYLNDQGIYVFIETHKTNRNKLPVGNRAFNKAGLKVIYQFLIHPQYLNKPYRFIGEQATVTIDTVRRVIHDLLKEKFIIQTNYKEYQFMDRVKLFQEWVTAFNKNLRPRLRQNKYDWLNKNKNWKKIKLPKHTYWGGAAAAEQLTNYLIADKLVIYTSQPFQEVMKKLKVTPNSDGTITLMEQFWENNEEGNTITHPILTYADLINEADPRYVETANKIYKDYVEDKL